MGPAPTVHILPFRDGKSGRTTMANDSMITRERIKMRKATKTTPANTKRGYQRPSPTRWVSGEVAMLPQLCPAFPLRSTCADRYGGAYATRDHYDRLHLHKTLTSPQPPYTKTHITPHPFYSKHSRSLVATPSRTALAAS